LKKINLPYETLRKKSAASSLLEARTRNSPEGKSPAARRKKSWGGESLIRKTQPGG